MSTSKLFLVVMSIALCFTGFGIFIVPFLWFPVILGDGLRKGLEAASQMQCKACKGTIHKNATICKFCRTAI